MTKDEAIKKAKNYLKDIGLIIKTDEFVSTSESKVIITLYIDKLKNTFKEIKINKKRKGITTTAG